ncbi:hypothetical protein ACFOZ5_01995 [Marinobacter lacisalsi]|uniref:Uncharacterized protein n=1 Tax=Marinobacter lacisalsi TaxID=475979 RepID=A0ABV8QDV2_9GAMM
MHDDTLPPVVSGRYHFTPGMDPEQSSEASLRVVVRVDVDGPEALDHLSVEVVRRFPAVTAHGVARVTADRARDRDRILEADLYYLDGDANLLPGRRLVFEASGLQAGGQPTFTLSFADRRGLGSYPLWFRSRYFDPIEFEVDRVENAGPVVHQYRTDAHPNRPSDLPANTLTLANVYEQAGFSTGVSADSGPIPLVEAGADGAWSDSEMHNAMVTYWSRFADRPQWALWVLYASLHEQGEMLGGVMFDDIGPHHRQGTAVFTESFINNPPLDDPAPQAWRERMQFWTAIHEMGHAFNLAHSWQKALGDPWMPLTNRIEPRSFMNYPFNVEGGEDAFFSDFRFRFTDEERLFMRHAPRRFVQMGHSDWFQNHGFEAPGDTEGGSPWQLQLRPNREVNAYAFLEPVVMELKLTNLSPGDRSVDPDLLAFGNDVMLFVQRDGAPLRRWRNMTTRCYRATTMRLARGESIYGCHNISCSTGGWLIDEPGFYKVQAALEVDGRILVSNIQRLYVAPPAQPEENRLAPDYFSEDVARALVFHGVPALPGAMSLLRELAARCPENPAALHAALAFSAPDLRDYKVLDDEGADRFRVRCHRARLGDVAVLQRDTLLSSAGRAADTFGHIAYFRALEDLADALYRHGDQQGARGVRQAAVDTMKQRAVSSWVIRRAEDHLGQF